MTQISDLFTHFMNLVNLKYYNKEESDSKYLEDLEINIESDGKLYVVDTLQDSLTLTSNKINAYKGDTVTLTASLKDKDNHGIGHVPIKFYNNNVLIDTKITQNNGSASINYDFTSKGEYEFYCKTRKKTSESIEGEVTFAEFIFTVTGTSVPSPSFPYDTNEDLIIDWGDGTTSTVREAHTYSDGLESHTITITADFNQYIVCPIPNKSIVTSISSLPPLTTMYNGAFSGCSNLASVDFSNCTKLTTLRSGEFNSSGLTSVDLTGCASLETITNASFGNCMSLVSVILPSSLITLSSGAFSGCSNLASVDFSNCTKLTTLNGGALTSCTSLTSVDLSECRSLTTIDGTVFNGCTNLESFTLPQSVTTINGSFNSCSSLTNIDLSYCTSLTTLGDWAFSGCNNLKSITFPASLTTIGENIFYYKNNVESIVFMSDTPPTLGGCRVPTSCVIYVPQGTLSAYTSASNYPDPSEYTYVEYSSLDEINNVGE